MAIKNKFATEQYVDNASKGLFKTVAGENMVLQDSKNAPLKGLTVFGKTTLKTYTQKRNLFDGQLEFGFINTSTGVLTDNTGCVRNVNPIPVSGGMKITVSNNKNYYCRLFEYDANMNFLKNTVVENGDSYTFTTLENTRFLRFRSDQSSQQNDITVLYQITISEKVKDCICVGSDGNVNIYIENQMLSISTPNGLHSVSVSENGNYIDENGSMYICDTIDFKTNKYIQRVNFTGEAVELLDVPVETDLSITEIETFKKLTTCYPTTEISNDSNAHMEIEYCVSLDNYLLKNKVDDYFMPLKGKRLSIMGDSISTFGTPNQENARGTWTYPGNRCRYPQGNLITNVKLHYWKKLLDKTGMVLGVNESWAGSTVSWDGTTESTDIGKDKHMASNTRIKHLGENGLPDVILVYAGTNDAGRAVTLGTVNTASTIGLTESEINALPVNTFADAYRTMLIRMQHQYPDAKIIVVNLTYTVSYFTYAELKKYSDVISELCELLGVKCIDLRKCGMSSLNIANYLPDGIHPAEEGFELMFQYIYNELISDYSLYNAHRDNEKKIVENAEWYVNSTSVADYSETNPANLHNGGWRYTNETTVLSYLNKEINAIRCCVAKTGKFNIYVMNESTHAIVDSTSVIFDRTSIREPEVFILLKPLTVREGQILVFGEPDEEWTGGSFYYQTKSKYPEYHFSSNVKPDVAEDKNNTNLVNLMIDIGYVSGYEINTVSRTSTNSYLQPIPSGTTSTDNLWEVLTPVLGYYKEDGLFGNTRNVGSITIPVLKGDRLYFNSMLRKELAPNSFSNLNGIRITYLLDDTIVSTITPDVVYYEGALYGYIIVPSGVNTVNIPVWDMDSDENFIRLIPAGDM